MIPSRTENGVDELDGVPLHLLDCQTLWDLETDEATEAVETRQHAYHEAGHAWSAYRSGLALRPASISRDSAPYAGVDDSQTAELAALGYLVQAASLEVETQQRDFGNVCATAEADHAQDYYEHLMSVTGAPCCCRRGGDDFAASLYENRAWLVRQVFHVVHDWSSIDALARRLMAVDVVNPHEIGALLEQR